MIKKVTLTPPPTSTASAVTLHDPANNTERFLSKIDGVVGPPAPRDVTRVRPGVDGVVDATAYLDARSITLEGELWKSTGGASLSDLSTISEALYATMLAPGRLEVTYENNTVRWCNVKLAGGVDVSVEGASRLLQYQVQLRASDPRMYATTLNSVTLTAPTTTGSLNVFYTSSGTTQSYAGTAPTPVTITATAPTAANLGTASSMRVTEIGVRVPTAYADLVPNQWTSANFNYPSWLIVSGATAGSGSGSDYIFVEPEKVRKFTSSTRTAENTNTTAAISAPMQGVASVSEFPYLYPGTNTWLVRAWAFAGSGTVGLTGATFKFEWYDAYW